MSDLPTFAGNFAVITPVAFLAMGLLLLLGGLAYARPTRFDARSLRRWRRKLATAHLIPSSTSRSNAEIEELTQVWRRQQRYFLTGAGVGLVVATTTLLLVVLVAPDQALVNAIFSSMYGLGVAITSSFLAMSVGACLGYALNFRRYPPLVARSEDSEEVAHEGAADGRPLWRRISTYRPWYVALSPWGILALYTVLTVVCGARLAQTPRATYNFDIAAVAERYVALHIWLLGVPLGVVALALVIVEYGLRSFVRSPERRFTADAQLSRYVNLGLRTQLVTASLFLVIWVNNDLFASIIFLQNLFPLNLEAFIGVPFGLLSILLIGMMGKVNFPKESLTEALGTP